MFKRRDALKFGLAAAGTGLASNYAWAVKQHENRIFPQSGFVPPFNYAPAIEARPSPKVTPFVQPLFEMPVAQPVPQSDLALPENGGMLPDPDRHQRFDEFLPQNHYIQRFEENLWQYHPEGPYANGSWGYTMNGIMPGETFKSFYGEPTFVRRINDVPPLGQGNVNFTIPSFTVHLHNGHTGSESDGIPMDYFNPGEFWDHHYPNVEAGFDVNERMNTLWYHDHRLDFTATNVYAGLSGFYLLFSDTDSDNERDPNPQALRLPSGKYDVPLMIHDVQFDQNGQVVWDFFTPSPAPLEGDVLPIQDHAIFGMTGDQMTVNRKIQPYFEVEARKYRFRVLNGGPSRLYDFILRPDAANPQANINGRNFYLLSNDGNLYEEAREVDHVEIWVANRSDIIIDFSHFEPGDHVYMINRLEARMDGAGPTGKFDEEGYRMMRFDVVASQEEDPSRIPDRMREFPEIDLSEVRRERTWEFDYDNGLWTVNGRLMDPNNVDARIESGSAEIWTIRNAGDTWTHPIHTHFEEFRIIEKNGMPVSGNDPLNVPKDVIELGPKDEIKFFSRWRDFKGRHVMHCHNVVHEDHAMMIRWDMVEPGEGD